MSFHGRRDNEGSKTEDGITMIKADSITLGALSELFINLSAAWFFTAILTPFSRELSVQMIIVVLTVNLALGILCLEIGIKLRRLKKKYGN